MGVPADRLPLGGPGPARVRAPRLPPRRRVLLVHLLAHPGALPVRARRPAGDVPRGQGPPRRPGPGLGRHRGRPRAGRAATRPHAARAAWSGPAGTRPPRSSPPPTCTPSRRWGPDRVAGFSPIPAMSMVSHAAGARFVNLIGGSMLSFYDWYADLPVASPQVFGDQTDVPESGDWWDAGYLIMWGSNLPVTRTPDAHWMTEARYRGQKVIAVAPDYADNVKFADEWLPARPGTDGALAMAMGHVILKEFFVDRAGAVLHRLRVPLHRPAVPGPASSPSPADGRPTCHGKFLTAEDLGGDEAASENAAFKTVLLDAGTGEPVVPNGSLGHRFGDQGVGRWNLDLGDVRPLLSVTGGDEPPVTVHLPRFDDARRHRSGPRARRAGPPGERAPGHHGVRPDAGPVRRRAGRPPRDVAHGVRRRRRAVHARVAGAHHRGARGGGRADRSRVRRQRRGVAGPLDDRHGRRHQPLVPLRHHLPRVPDPDQPHRLPGRQRRRLGALRRAGEGAARSPATPRSPTPSTGRARRAT